MDVILLILRATKVGGFLGTYTSDILSLTGMVFHRQGTTYKDWSIYLRLYYQAVYWPH